MADWRSILYDTRQAKAFIEGTLAPPGFKVAFIGQQTHTILDDVVTFTDVVYDRGGFANEDIDTFVVPAGLGGVYRYEASAEFLYNLDSAEVGDDYSVMCTCEIDLHDVDWNVFPQVVTHAYLPNPDPSANGTGLFVVQDHGTFILPDGFDLQMSVFMTQVRNVDTGGIVIKADFLAAREVKIGSFDEDPDWCRTFLCLTRIGDAP